MNYLLNSSCRFSTFSLRFSISFWFASHSFLHFRLIHWGGGWFFGRFPPNWGWLFFGADICWLSFCGSSESSRLSESVESVSHSGDRIVFSIADNWLLKIWSCFLFIDLDVFDDVAISLRHKKDRTKPLSQRSNSTCIQLCVRCHHLAEASNAKIYKALI